MKRASIVEGASFVALMFLACAGGSGAGNGFSSEQGSDGGAAALDSPSSPAEDAAIPPLSGSYEGGTDIGSGPAPAEPTGPVTDFPNPVLDGAAPANSTSLFGPMTSPFKVPAA
jgi:hypothetical protein